MHKLASNFIQVDGQLLDHFGKQRSQHYPRFVGVFEHEPANLVFREVVAEYQLEQIVLSQMVAIDVMVSLD